MGPKHLRSVMRRLVGSVREGQSEMSEGGRMGSEGGVEEADGVEVVAVERGVGVAVRSEV